jgi:CheY-like chemotaxis protein
MIAVLDASDRSPVAPSAARGKTFRILVVDDDAAILRLEKTILECDGHCVETAKDGEAAWQALQDGAYDLLVTDNIMSGLSGLALVRQLRLANITLPVVMVSGTVAHLDTAKLTRDPGARINGFVGKPFTIHQLLSAVHRALDSVEFGTVSGRFGPE